MTKDVMEFLRSKLVTAGVKNVYIGDAPSLQLNCVSIRPVDGYASTLYFCSPSMQEPLLEIIVRNDDYLTGQSEYNLIQKTLDKLVDRDIGILSCLLTGSPGYLGKDVEGFNEWHMIFHITVEE